MDLVVHGFFLQASLESKTHEAEKKIHMEKQGRIKASTTNEKLLAEKSELEEALAKGDSLIKDMENKARKVEMEKKEVDRQVKSPFSGMIFSLHVFV